MNYYSKYLPIIGEIKHHDFYFSYRDGIRYKHKEGLNKMTPEDKLCKPFLCSRDIQVGDRVRTFERTYPEYVEKITDYTITILQGGHPVEHDINQCYKIIGEISEEATWVKDDDEYDENEVEQISITQLYEDDYYLKEDNTRVTVEEVIEEEVKNVPLYESHKIISRIRWKDSPDEIEVRVFKKQYKIKGPCGHFH